MHPLRAPRSPLAVALLAIDASHDPSAFGGEFAASESIAVVFPDGSEIVFDPADPDAFVQRIVDRAEPAPFGDGTKTRTDPSVRDALRLRDRSAVVLRGIDLQGAGVLDAIERTLSPRERIAVSLTDVIVYPPDGHFAVHRDTPREPDLLGTLVVSLPIAHRGGALTVDAGKPTERVFDWSSSDARTVHWAAMFGDAEHAVAAVTEGHRVTVTYSIRTTGEARTPTDDRAAPFREALAEAMKNPAFMADGGTLVLPCARHAIVPLGGEDVVPDLRALRGLDRDLCEAARELGLAVGLRACIALADQRDSRKEPVEPVAASVDVLRLARPLGEKTIARLGENVTFAGRARDDMGEPVEATSLASKLFGGERDDSYLVRPRARATFAHEGTFSYDGYFGNEHFEAWMYTLVAIEIGVRSAKARGALPPDPPARRVRHAKFGEGTVEAELPSGDDVVLTIRFDADQQVRRLQKKFVVDV